MNPQAQYSIQSWCTQNSGIIVSVSSKRQSDLSIFSFHCIYCKLHAMLFHWKTEQNFFSPVCKVLVNSFQRLICTNVPKYSLTLSYSNNH